MGYDLAEFAPQSVARQFGYLPQHGKLVQGTILENITMFRPELTTEAFRIAGMLGLEADIAMLPTGYDTSVGEGAVGTLPPGVSQRVAIARALVDRPPIVLFDEANVEMSPAGESFVKTTLTWLKGGCTMVLATRSPSILKLADRTYELGGGDIVPHDPQLAALVHQL